ncbi:sodium- and chloride-dependent glycine transporter 2-like [Ptychodera flava]|uniref:sodium- and chloride-dependent glycine transporter 2-like n=1 Tax=Ptychodera flava TaxID=63121 RepID=UPI003969DD58
MDAVGWREDDTDSVATDVELREVSAHANFSKDENQERGNWSRKAEFILASLGYAVGLGNIWRFPYLCYANGGGAFLIPYIIMTVFVGFPIFFVELTMGQFSSQGCITVWRFSPLFKGLGYCMVILSSMIAIFYNVIVSWCLLYFFASFSALPGLPWQGCGNDWNTASCYDDRTNTTPPANATSPTAEYFRNYVLKQSSGIEETGSIQWHLALCLLLAWVLTFCVLFKGIKSLGKIAYFMVPLPYVVLFALLIRGATLPGSSEGIRYYMEPNWSRLTDINVWEDAASQVFFSLSASFGGLHVMASYNKFKNNLYADALIIPIINFLTSFFAGFAIFAVLGFMAHDTGRRVDEVASSGVGLAFMAFPEVIVRMPGAPFWAIVFFLMLVVVGLSSQFVMVQTIVTSLYDDFESLRHAFQHRRWVLPGILCAIFFLLGLPHVTEGGLYWFLLVDTYSVILSVIPVALAEILVVTFVYGFRRLLTDVESMVGQRSSAYWIAMFITSVGPMFAAPLILGFVMVFSFIDYKPLAGYPTWADPVLAWMIVTVCIGPLFAYMIYQLVVKETGSFMERLSNSVKPASDWGPMLERHRQEAGYPPKDGGLSINPGGFPSGVDPTMTFEKAETTLPSF